MLPYPTKHLALVALAAALGAGPAVAGGGPCCPCEGGCAPVVVAPPVAGPFYIVDQGPNYSGPGIILVPGYVAVDTAPATYPYVGRDYYFPSLYPDVRPTYHHVHRRHVRWHKAHRVHVSGRVKHSRPPYDPKRPFDPNDK